MIRMGCFSRTWIPQTLMRGPWSSSAGSKEADPDDFLVYFNSTCKETARLELTKRLVERFGFARACGQTNGSIFLCLEIRPGQNCTVFSSDRNVA